MKLKNIWYIILLCCTIIVISGCASTDEVSESSIARDNLLGRWEGETEFTYKENGVIYGKAKDSFVFIKGATSETLYVEIQVMLLDTTEDTPSYFLPGVKRTVYLNEAMVNAIGKDITLDATSPYVSPSKFNFILEDGNLNFTWEDGVYTKTQ